MPKPISETQRETLEALKEFARWAEERGEELTITFGDRLGEAIKTLREEEGDAP